MKRRQLTVKVVGCGPQYAKCFGGGGDFLCMRMGWPQLKKIRNILQWKHDRKGKQRNWLLFAIVFYICHFSKLWDMTVGGLLLDHPKQMSVWINQIIKLVSTPSLSQPEAIRTKQNGRNGIPLVLCTVTSKQLGGTVQGYWKVFPQLERTWSQESAKIYAGGYSENLLPFS